MGERAGIKQRADARTDGAMSPTATARRYAQFAPPPPPREVKKGMGCLAEEGGTRRQRRQSCQDKVATVERKRSARCQCRHAAATAAAAAPALAPSALPLPTRKGAGEGEGEGGTFREERHSALSLREPAAPDRVSPSGGLAAVPVAASGPVVNFTICLLIRRAIGSGCGGCEISI